jgi:hypothetical protein
VDCWVVAQPQSDIYLDSDDYDYDDERAREHPLWASMAGVCFRHAPLALATCMDGLSWGLCALPLSALDAVASGLV